MTHSREELRDALDRVARAPASAVRFDTAAAWRDGRRRRVRSRSAAAVAVVAAVLAGVLAAPFVPAVPADLSPASGSDTQATQHPVRLDYVYWDDQMPARTGPLAGVLKRNGNGVTGWYAVSPTGHLWRLHPADDYWPSVSPDGSHLGYMEGSFLDATFLITNQLDGTRVRFPQIGTGSTIAGVGSSEPHRYFHSSQSPAFWSPDGSHLLLRISLNDLDDRASESAAAVLGADGSFTALPQPRGAGGANPIGWVDDQHVAIAGGVMKHAAPVRVWVLDVQSGDVVRDFRLSDGSRDGQGQWFGSLSPDGTELATAAPQGDVVRFYSMQGSTQGQPTGQPEAMIRMELCSPSWSSTAFFGPPAGTSDAAVLASASGETTITADPRLDVDCSTWARTALDGPAHESLGARIFGQQDNWWAWHWRELASSALFLLALALGLALLAKRRRPTVRSTS